MAAAIAGSPRPSPDAPTSTWSPSTFAAMAAVPAGGELCAAYDELIDDLLNAIEWAHTRSFPDAIVSCWVIPTAGRSRSGRACAIRPGSPGLSSRIPVLRVSVEVPPAKLKVARFLARHAPWVTLKGSSERRVADARPRDPAGASHRPATPQPHERTALFRHGRGRGDAAGAAGEIKITDPDAAGGAGHGHRPRGRTRIFSTGSAADDKTLSIYPKMLHEPLNEIGRQQVLDDVLRWIEPRL